MRGSQWFAERFSAKGISAAHIDGDDVWVNGESYTSNQEVRDEVMRRFRSGEINILCNRFVLREGWDCPEVAHCIFATTFGSIQSYLQSGGRVLRAHPSIQSVVVQDHGGNWLRHGSLNADRIWSLDDTSKSLAEARRDELRQKNSEPDSHVGEDGEPMVCPNCYRPRRVVIGQDNSVCPYCDHRCSKKSRYVRQIDGTLKRVWGDAYRLPVRKAIPDDQKKWQQVYFSCKNSGKTFKQAEGWFFRQYRAWPRLDMKYMPKNREDFTRRIKDVPNHNLHGFDR
jgi:superfamily II DNA or RNA helicase